MGPTLLCGAAAVWIVIFDDSAFWRAIFASEQGVPSFAIVLALGLVALQTTLLRLLTPGRSLKPVLSIVLLAAAVAGYFSDTYGVGIDNDMLRNLLQTDSREARELVCAALLWRVTWSALLPIWILWRVRLPPTTWLESARGYVLGAVSGAVVLCALVLPRYAAYAALLTNQPEVRHLVAPLNVVGAAVRLARQHWSSKQSWVVVGADASRSVRSGARPFLIVLVVGETARAASFSLGGYARETNPQLRGRDDILYFDDVWSCGTSTAVSLPCMFSDLPQGEFDLGAAGRRDTVLDILQRSGVDVTWIENQSGCKGVCEHIPTEHACPPGGARHERDDADLLRVLDAKLPGVHADAMLVLHSIGSHGPAYYRRVPEEYARFQPTCATERIETCTSEQIVNAFDNTILYTDHVLAGLIDRLDAERGRIDAAFLYISDHGESLGEHGLYLHGQPYLIAPDVQKRVPMLLWFSPGARARLELDVECLRGKLGEPYSHDYLSHTLLGLADVRTEAYRPEFDMLRACRGPRGRVIAAGQTTPVEP
jgi:lipid A ethanolaminephosphotransferase